METSHIHNYKKEGNYYVCNCGKRILAFENNIATRSDGKKYTKKSNVNRFLFPEELMKLEDALKPRAKHCFKCLFYTGARINEIRFVNLRDDFIYNQNGRSRLIIRHTKTKARKGDFMGGKTRDIPLSKQFAKYLYSYLKDHPDGKINFLTTAGFNTMLKQTADNIGIKDPQDLSAHSLRKTFEVWLMSLGVDSLPLTAHLGHDIATAASHYVSPDIFSWEDKRQMRIILGDIYLS
ncbi:MAG: site-specific integrase [Spirochaetia bacterium]|nr:site-specific integrase [Spirochaetia bacterium]